MFDLPYLRGTVNLLPFFLPLLGSFLLGRCSLEAQREQQEEDGDFLHAHSGAIVGACRGQKETNCLNYEREAVCSNTTTLTLNRCLVTPEKLQHFVCAYENKNLQKSFLFSTLTASRLVSASLTSLTSHSWQIRYCKVKWVNLSGLSSTARSKQKASQWRNILE